MRRISHVCSKRRPVDIRSVDLIKSSTVWMVSKYNKRFSVKDIFMGIESLWKDSSVAIAMHGQSGGRATCMYR